MISDFETDNSYWRSVHYSVKVVLLYEARVTNSLLGNHRRVDWTAVPDLRQGAWGSLPGSCTSGALTRQVVNVA